MEKRCEYCGGKLEWVAVPESIYIIGEPRKPQKIGTFRICQQCGKVHEKDLEREKVSFFGEQ